MKAEFLAFVIVMANTYTLFFSKLLSDTKLVFATLDDTIASEYEMVTRTLFNNAAADSIDDELFNLSLLDFRKISMAIISGASRFQFIKWRLKIIGHLNYILLIISVVSYFGGVFFLTAPDEKTSANILIFGVPVITLLLKLFMTYYTEQMKDQIVAIEKQIRTKMY